MSRSAAIGSVLSHDFLETFLAAERARVKARKAAEQRRLDKYKKQRSQMTTFRKLMA